MSTIMPEPSVFPHDVDALARLAGEIFRAMPGGGGALPPAPSPGLAPPPATASSLPPAGTGIPPGGAPLSGVGAPPPDRPFDFAAIPPLSASLPDEGQLKALLAPAAPEAAGGIPATAPAEPDAPRYYFLDPEVSGTSPGVPSGTPPQAGDRRTAFDAAAVRSDFPILKERVNGRPLVWLDNAATTQKPRAVIERLAYFYEHENSNIHRAAHELAARSTDAYEGARDTVKRFLGAGSSEDIVFVRGATEGINLVAQSWGRRHIGAGDEIVVTWLEHHANIVPWQQLCRETGARLRVVPVDDDGQILLDEYERLLTDRTKLVSFTQVSNALGTVTPAKQMVEMARRRGARVLVDGAQSVSHMPVDVQILDCDWFVFSGHKVFGPTGIGAVYGKPEVLRDMPPWQGGGNMIRDVTFEKTEYQEAPARFEAGTGNIADAVGLGAALEYVMRIGMETIARHEHDLLAYATRLLSEISGLRIVGTAAEKAGVVSFVLSGIPPEEVGRALNREGIAVRSGHHCAQPILRRFGLEASVRPSFAFYNTFADIDALVAAVMRVRAGTLPVS